MNENKSTISIVSLNVNRFYGKKGYMKAKNPKEENTKERFENLNKVVEFVEQYDKQCNIVLLHEINVQGEPGYVDLITKMKDKGIEYHFPQCFQDNEYPTSGGNSRQFITMAFSKTNFGVSRPEEDYSNGWARNVELKVSDIHIIGVHLFALDRPGYKHNANFKRNFEPWNKLLEYVKENKDKTFIIMGDFNAYDKDTHQYCLLRILLEHLKDVWLEKGGENDHPTHLKSRLDYALVSPSLLNDVVINYLDETRDEENGFTDHSAVSLKLKIPVSHLPTSKAGEEHE